MGIIERFSKSDITMVRNGGDSKFIIYSKSIRSNEEWRDEQMKMYQYVGTSFR